MTLHVGQLDQRLTLKRPSGTEDALGQPDGLYVAVVTVWGAAKPARGRDFVVAGKEQADGIMTFVINYRVDVEPSWIVVWRGANYHLIGFPVDPYGEKRILELPCKREAA